MEERWRDGWRGERRDQGGWMKSDQCVINQAAHSEMCKAVRLTGRPDISNSSVTTKMCRLHYKHPTAGTFHCNQDVCVYLHIVMDMCPLSVSLDPWTVSELKLKSLRTDRSVAAL